MNFQSIHWDAVIEGATAGIIASVLLAPWSVLRDAIRNCFLKRALHRQFERISCGHGIQGITTQVPNFVGKEFTVRRVTLVFDRVECPFYPTGEVASCAKPTKPKLNKEQKEKLQSGDAIPVSVPRIELARWQVAPSQNGFATITPFTSHQFLLPAELIVVALDANPICLSFVVEYQSWTQKTMLMELRTVGNPVKLLQKTCEHYRTEVLSGNLNKSRRMFGFPEVKSPTVKASVS